MQESRLFRNLLIAILLGFSQLALGQVRVNLNNSYSVTFPLKPLKTRADSITVVYSANQKGAYYIASVKDMGKMADRSSNDSLKRFYNDLIKSTIKKLNGKLSYQKDITINGAKGVDFGYTIDSKTGFADTRFQQSVYLNKTLLSFSFWTFKDKLEANTADKEVFFNTIATSTEEAPPAPYTAAVKADTNIIDKTPAQQTASKATASRVGYSVGMLLGALILGAFIVGIIVLIRKTSSNNKKKK
ncbi:MAG: hypothetical protein ABIN91_11430 [Mucilaginibacter sp.]|uniref:hypothetical protein n=1 Tax=Mucilaginibacter sp. TaxID=1882438 RepID=UPI003262CD68